MLVATFAPTHAAYLADLNHHATAQGCIQRQAGSAAGDWANELVAISKVFSNEDCVFIGSDVSPMFGLVDA
jgi:hypothetical protein